MAERCLKKYGINH